MGIHNEAPYTYKIRQHMNNSFETVLYAVPTKEKVS